MPYRSMAQRRFMHAAEDRGEVEEGTAARWEAHTPDKDLPERKGEKKTAADGLSNAWNSVQGWMAKQTPETRSGVYGAGLGGSLGILNYLLSNKRGGSLLGSAAGGAALGGAAGYGGRYLFDRSPYKMDVNLSRNEPGGAPLMDRMPSFQD